MSPTLGTNSYPQFLHLNLPLLTLQNFFREHFLHLARYTALILTSLVANFEHYPNIKADVFDVRINWSEITGRDMDELEGYVRISKSQKMQSVFGVIKKEYVDF